MVCVRSKVIEAPWLAVCVGKVLVCVRMKGARYACGYDPRLCALDEW